MRARTTREKQREASNDTSPKHPNEAHVLLTMPVRIRLARFGRIRDPFYRIRVQDSRRSRNGKFIEQLGTYDPIPNNADHMKEVRLNVERLKYWLSVGAQPSKPVARLLGYCGLLPRYVNKSSVQNAVPKAEREKKKKK